jgi:hypothetical protein
MAANPDDEPTLAEGSKSGAPGTAREHKGAVTTAKSQIHKPGIRMSSSVAQPQFNVL